MVMVFVLCSHKRYIEWHMTEINPEANKRFLDAVDEYLVAEVDRHQQERKDWNYHDIFSRETIAELAAVAPIDVEPDVRLIYAANLNVETGLPEYDRVMSEVFEPHANARRWKNLWVSEEGPHAISMEEAAIVRGLLTGEEMHQDRKIYAQNGLTLNFMPDAAFGFAFPAFQEPATKLTHKSVKDRLPEGEKELRRLLAKICGDEERHERLNVNMVRHSLETGEVEVVSRMMIAVARAAIGFTMPAIESDIDQERSKQFKGAYSRTGAFTLGMIAKDVILELINSEGDNGWRLRDRTELTDEAKVAQADIIDFAEKLEAKGDREKGLLVVMEKGRRNPRYGRVA